MAIEQLLKIKQDLLSAFDDTLADPLWDKSLFYRNMKKKIQQLRENIATNFQVDAEEKMFQNYNHTIASIAAKFNEHTKVFITIYQASGDNLENWQNVIKTLPYIYASRPIYKEEAHVMTSIRNRAEPAHEAYVTAWIKKSDILPQTSLSDRFGQPLLTIKENRIPLDHISEFVYKGLRHTVIEGRIQAVTDENEAATG